MLVAHEVWSIYYLEDCFVRTFHKVSPFRNRLVIKLWTFKRILENILVLFVLEVSTAFFEGLGAVRFEARLVLARCLGSCFVFCIFLSFKHLAKVNQYTLVIKIF